MAASDYFPTMQQVGNATRDELAHLNNVAGNMNQSLFYAPADTLSALGRGVMDFGRGFIGGAPAAAAVPAPTAAPVVAAAPPPPAAAQAYARGQAMTARDIMGLGKLSPAAQAVLQAASPQTLAAAQTAQNKTTAASQPAGVPSFEQLMAGYAAGNGGKISLRAMDALAGAAQKGAAAAYSNQRQPSIADIAGAQALQLGNQLFNSQKQQAAQKGDDAGYLKLNQEHLEMLERLSRARQVDPLGAYAYGQSPDGQ